MGYTIMIILSNIRPPDKGHLPPAENIGAPGGEAAKSDGYRNCQILSIVVEYLTRQGFAHYPHSFPHRYVNTVFLEKIRETAPRPPAAPKWDGRGRLRPSGPGKRHPAGPNKPG